MGHNLMLVNGEIQHRKMLILANIYIIHIIAIKMQKKVLGNLIN